MKKTHTHQIHSSNISFDFDKLNRLYFGDINENIAHQYRKDIKEFMQLRHKLPTQEHVEALVGKEIGDTIYKQLLTLFPEEEKRKEDHNT